MHPKSTISPNSYLDELMVHLIRVYLISIEPLPLYPPLLERRGGGIKRRGFAPSNYPLISNPLGYGSNLTRVGI